MVLKVDESKLPAWIRKAIQGIAECFEISTLSGTAYRVLKTEDGWEMWFYPALTEMVGGDHDGEQLSPGQWHVEISDIMDLFRKPCVMWCNFEDIPEISIEGKMKGGGELWLHLLQHAPEDEEAEATFDVNRRSHGQKEGPDTAPDRKSAER